jgi:SAM-dependent methyltransferase
MSKRLWDEHWRKHITERTLFESFSSLFRDLLLSKYMKFLADRYFPQEGVFLEAGSGTSQSSSRISKFRRRLIALDYSIYPLKEARKIAVIDDIVAGNIFSLPFSDNTLDGIWNLGVMEHFTEDELVKIYSEFVRVLKKNGKVIILIPPVFGPFHIAFTVVERIISLINRKKYRFWPDMITPFRGRRGMERIFQRSKLRILATHFSWRSFFIHYAIIAEPLIQIV